MGFYPCQTTGCGGYFCSVDLSSAPHARFCELAPEPWWKSDEKAIERMKAWKGVGPPPNYLQRAYHAASPSLLHVALRIRDEGHADRLVQEAHTSQGARLLVRSGWLLKKFAKEE